MNRPPKNIYSPVALALLSFLFVTNVYRAATQSITIDEAFTYHQHITPARFWSFPHYTANNHVVNTVLAKFTTSLFGLSELSLRLPSLAGGLLYFAGLWRLGRILFGPSPWFLLFIAVNSLNPFILDFLSVARGYGMGLGFLVWALAFLMEGHAARTGLALGLAVASQLTYAVPAAAMGAVFLARHSFRSAWRLAGTAALTAASILAWPMREARPEHFYVGEASPWQPLRMLGETALLYKPTALYSSYAALDWIAVLAVAGCAAALGVALVTRDRKLAAVCGVLFGSAALLGAARLLVARPFPSGRAALYFYPLVSLVLLLLLARVRRPALQAAAAAVAVACVVQYALEFNVSYYWVYKADAGVKRLFRAMEASEARQPARALEAKVGASWELSDSLNFYRLMRDARWMRPVTREGADCYFDYYVLAEKDAGLMARYGLVEVNRDVITGARLGQPGKAALRRLAAIYPPPIQTAPPCRADLRQLGSFARMGEPEAAMHIIQDIATDPPGADTRWTYARPILVFRPGPHYFMRIRLLRELVPEGSGPLEISFLVNGRHVATRSYTTGGEHDFQTPVPPEYTRGYPLAVVELRSSRHYIPPGDDAVLGFELVSAGFTNNPQ